MTGDAVPRTVAIEYRRPPDDVVVYRQQIVHRDAGVTVTFQPATPLSRPVTVDGRVVLEPGAPAVWFTFPGAWHDIGRFHLADGTFTGIYANVLTPVEEFAGDDPSELGWRTTDLCLDVFVDPSGRPHLLDEDEFEAALARGWFDTDTAARAQREAEALMRTTGEGTWPPPVVAEWSLQRVRELTGGESTDRDSGDLQSSS